MPLNTYILINLEKFPCLKSKKSRSGYDNHHGWVFVSNNFNDKVPARTYSTLYALSEKYTYFTPNSFYRNDKREKSSLRWINAFVVDIDIKHEQNQNLVADPSIGIDVPTLLDKVESIGLVPPTLVVKTPSGGVHVYWFLDDKKRATTDVCKFYESITSYIAESLGGD